MKERKLVYEATVLEVYYFDDEDIVTLSGNQSGPMDEEDLGDMGL